ncbi:pollen-specific leucine-rich repeat extensin-like protein 1 [Gadus morhua]|uniref:pollen-specific leucine-rich repeat extensin-like protein 1 n=1 Tax=Gadus morhua TaxID=8049 RepID=UPI0011B5891E|nr:pollen-specific leucine-rich repeat extensin-like protein 1 [Gadus morhua]
MVMGPSRADSVPYDGNITVKAATRSGESPGVYTRDLAIAAPVCFTGGVVLTLMVVLIYQRLSRRRREKKARKEREKEQEAEGGRAEEQDSSAWGRRRELASPGDRRPPWDGGPGALDPSRAVGGGGHLKCPHCRGAGPGAGDPRAGGLGARAGGLGAREPRVGGLGEGGNQTRSEQGGVGGRSGMPPHRRALIPNVVANGGPGHPPPRDRAPRGILRPHPTGKCLVQSRTHGDLSGRGSIHYRSEESGDHYKSEGPGDHYRSEGSGDHYKSEGPGDHYRSEWSGDPDHYRSGGSGDHYKSEGSGDHYRSEGSGDHYRSEGPGDPDHYRSEGPGDHYRSEGPGDDYRSEGPGDNYRSGPAPQARGFLSRLICDHCNQTSGARADDVSSSQEGLSLGPSERPALPKSRPRARGARDLSPRDRRGRRNVTFYLERPLEPRRSGDKTRKRGEGGKREGRQRTRGHSRRLLKVNLNLSPVRRNKVHPGKSSEKRSSRGEGRGPEGRKENASEGEGDQGGGRKEKKNETKISKNKKVVEENKTSSEEKPSQQSSELDQKDSVGTTDQSEASRAPEGLTPSNELGQDLQLGPPPCPPPAPASVSLTPSAARPAARPSLRALLPPAPTLLHRHANSSLAAHVASPGLRGLTPYRAAPAGAQGLALHRGLRHSASAASLLASPGRSRPLLGRAASTPSFYTGPPAVPAPSTQPLSPPQPPPESLPPAPRPPAESLPPAPRPPAESLSPAPRPPTESLPLAPRPPAESLPLAPRPPAESLPLAPRPPAESLPPAPRPPAESLPLAPRPPTESLPLAPRPPAESLPPAPRPPADPPQGPGLQAGQDRPAQGSVAGRGGAGPPGEAGGGDGDPPGPHWLVAGGPVVASHSASGARRGALTAAGDAEGSVTSVPVEGAEEGVVSSPGGVVSSPRGVATAGSQALLQQEYLSEDRGSSPKRKLKLVLPEKASSRPPTALERKIR